MKDPEWTTVDEDDERLGGLLVLLGIRPVVPNHVRLAGISWLLGVVMSILQDTEEEEKRNIIISNASKSFGALGVSEAEMNAAMDALKFLTERDEFRWKPSE
jgi:hypothetical protein